LKVNEKSCGIRAMAVTKGERPRGKREQQGGINAAMFPSNKKLYLSSSKELLAHGGAQESENGENDHRGGVKILERKGGAKRRVYNKEGRKRDNTVSEQNGRKEVC